MQRLVQIHLNASGDQIANAIATAADHGCCGIELACASADLSDSINSQSVLDLLAEGERRGLGACAALCLDRFNPGSLTSDDAVARRIATGQIERAIELASSLKAARVSVAPALISASEPNRASYQDALNRTFDAFQQVVRHAENCGIKLCLRAARHGFLMSPPEMRELIHRLNSHAIGADLDAHHRDDQAALDDWLETLGNLTCAVGLTEHGSGRLASVESDFARFAPAAAATAHVVLRHRGG